MSNPYHVSDAIAGLDLPDGVSDELAEHLVEVAHEAIDYTMMAVVAECSLRRTFVRANRERILREIRANLGDKVNPDLDEYALELVMDDAPRTTTHTPVNTADINCWCHLA